MRCNSNATYAFAADARGTSKGTYQTNAILDRAARAVKLTLCEQLALKAGLTRNAIDANQRRVANKVESGA